LGIALEANRFFSFLLSSALKIIDRYIGRQVSVAAFIGVATLSSVLVFGKLLKEIFALMVEKDMPLGTVVTFIGYILPFSLIYTIPWGFLTAVLLVFGRLSADNELVSLRMTGMSLARICRSVFVLAILLTALTLWINTTIFPRAKSKIEEAKYEMVVEDPLSLFVADKEIMDFKGFCFYTEGKVGDRLKNLEVIQLNAARRPIKYIHAHRAYIENDDESDNLILTLEDAKIVDRDSNSPTDVTKIKPGIKVGKTYITIPLDQLRRDPKKFRASILETSELIRRIDSSDKNSLTQKEINTARTEVNKRYSFSLACLTFALIGIPLGVTAQRRETSIGFALSLGIAALYFLFIIVADTLKDKDYAQYLMWVPNLVFMGLGIFLFMRLGRK
jgi:lipopolysaccharide export LptBFGC system permease protein LptF